MVVAPPQRPRNGVSQTTMGPQSQRRISLLDRTHQLQSQSHNNSNKRKKGAQQTLFGSVAFDPAKSCPKCRGGKSSHKGHHEKCWNNPRKRGMLKAMLMEEKRLKTLFEQPLTDAEKCSGQHLTKEATDAFFAAREGAVKVAAATTTRTEVALLNPTKSTNANIGSAATADAICTSVTTLCNDPAFSKHHELSTAPLAMLAFAKTVAKTIINNNKFETKSYFDGLTMTAPSTNKYMEPHCHSIFDSKLLNVDWIRMHGLEISCLRCPTGALENDCTNFSKNQMLFPIFILEGPPQWAMVQSMTCRCCPFRVDANDGELLCSLPACARQAYPVETKYANNKHSHIGRSATDVMDLLMPTYGNGDLCSRLLFNAMNRAYIERIQDYCSSYKVQKREGGGA